MSNTAIYWFTKDLRLRDNHALSLARKSENLLCVYIVDPRWFRPARWQSVPVGSHRWSFIQESLSDINQQLRDLNQRLHIYYGKPEEIIPELAHSCAANTLIATRLAGTYEKNTLAEIGRTCPSLDIKLVDQYTLFQQANLPFELEDLPPHYTTFRRKAEGFPVLAPIDAPTALPPEPKQFKKAGLELPSWLPTPSNKESVFKGGERSGQGHIAEYFATRHPLAYKEVRNHLDGWSNSSKFSPWLAQGCVSPRDLKAKLIKYEQQYERNDSTAWIYVELLWREYFQWLAHKIGGRLFTFKGNAKRKPLTAYYAERFQKWCDGTTPYPLVNACMKELKETGYMSNRGRQIVASCLVNELGTDWRYGASWFEQQLIDYDMAANWGNWQYIAGVGADPRGGRHFNLEKQTQIYDPEGVFQRKWKAVAGGPLDSVDAADWPIYPPQSAN